MAYSSGRRGGAGEDGMRPTALADRPGGPYKNRGRRAIPDSSMVEHPTVNRTVVGSSPTRGACPKSCQPKQFQLTCRRSAVRPEPLDSAEVFRRTGVSRHAATAESRPLLPPPQAVRPGRRHPPRRPAAAAATSTSGRTTRPESKAEYARVLAEWPGRRRRPHPAAAPAAAGPDRQRGAARVLAARRDALPPTRTAPRPTS